MLPSTRLQVFASPNPCLESLTRELGGVFITDTLELPFETKLGPFPDSRELFISFNSAAASQFKVAVSVNGEFAEFLHWQSGNARSVSIPTSDHLSSNVDVLSLAAGQVLNLRFTGSGRLNAISIAAKPKKLALREHVTESVTSVTRHDRDFSNFKTPVRSQWLYAGIGPRICGPTSVSQIATFHRHVVSPVQVALQAYDHGAQIFGNWAFLCAVAGELGLNAIGLWLNDIDELRHVVAKFGPTLISQRFGPGELSESPLSETSGHLLVVNHVTDSEVLVNDPAADSKLGQAIARRYSISEFAASWKRFAIVFAR